MKSMAELEAIRQRTLQRINLRKEDESENIRVVVGMATCGIAAGARPVMMKFMEEINNCTNLFITNKSTLNTNRLRKILWSIKHITISQQILCTSHINNSSGINSTIN